MPVAVRINLTAPLCLALAVFLLFSGCTPRKAKVPLTPKGTETPPAAGTELARQLDALFDAPEFQNAFWGVMVQSMDTGEVLYRRNAEKLFMPASNMKLLTGAAALLRLGKDYRVKTRVLAQGAVRQGVLEGSLIVEGGGDPTLSLRFAPDDLYAVFVNWAARLKEAGIREIRGDIIGDDDLLEEPSLGYGWAWDQAGYSYSAEAGALQFNENVVEIRVAAGGRQGQLAGFEMFPAPGLIQVENNVRTVEAGAETDISIQRDVEGNRVRMQGQIALGEAPARVKVAVHNPTLFFADQLRHILAREGIHVSGKAVDADDLNPKPDRGAAVLLWMHESPPLEKILAVLLKESQNLYAETLLRILGKECSGDGSFRAGRQAVQEILQGMAIPPGDYVMMDGSGLSRYNFLKPEMLLRLFRFLVQVPEFSTYYQSLPVGGVDGTLASRLKGGPAENNVHAKTGTLANVRSLSGFVRARDGELLGFSMIANHFTVPHRQAEKVQDAAAELLAGLARGKKAEAQD